MMDNAIHGCHGGHGVLEDPIPFTKDESGGNEHRFSFIPLSQEGKKHLHFIAIVLHRATVIEDDAAKRVELGEFLRQTQISLGSEQPLDQGSSAAPEDRMTSQDQLMANRSQSMAFSDAGFSHGTDIDCCLQERCALETLSLKLESRRKALRLKGQEGLANRQARLAK